MRSLLPLLLLTGCLAPKMELPEAPVAQAWPTEAVPDGTDVPDWQTLLPDPELRDVVGRALASNRDLRQTALAIESARARLRLASSALGPAVDLSATYSSAHTAESVSPLGRGYTIQQFSVGPAVSWEVDLFGKLRNTRRSAAEQTLAAAEDWRAARLALVAQVTRTALQERVQREQLALAEEALEARRQALDLVGTRVDAGLSTDLERRQAEVLVASAQVSVAQLQRAAAQTHNALVELVGEPVEPLSPTGPELTGLIGPAAPAGLPSDLLTRRPDVRAAERRLAAAHADIGAARAAFFPQIRLTAGLNTASPDLLGLFAPNTLAWNYALPSLTQPLFRWGQNRADLAASKVDRERMVASYEGAIQTAFREVADVLVAYPTLRAEREAQEDVTEAQTDRVQLATQRYEAGVADYLEVLDAERDRFAALQSLMDVRLQEALLAVDLFQVVGGGAEGLVPLPEEG